MNALDAAQYADKALNAATELMDGSVEQTTALQFANTYALLAQVQYLREIGDQLDTIPRPEPIVDAEVIDFDEDPLHGAASTLESIAIGDEGPARERTIARLVLHAQIPYVDAEQIARKARDWVWNEGRQTIEMKVVANAIASLGIVIDE